jgi:hypothetical protein
MTEKRAISSAQHAVFAASSGERFSLSPRQPVPLSTGLFAASVFEPSFPELLTALAAAWAASNQAEAVGFASVRQMMVRVSPYPSTRSGAISSIVPPA